MKNSKVKTVKDNKLKKTNNHHSVGVTGDVKQLVAQSITKEAFWCSAFFQFSKEITFDTAAKMADECLKLYTERFKV